MTGHFKTCDRPGDSTVTKINLVGKFRDGTVNPGDAVKFPSKIRLCEMCSRFHRRNGKCECEGCKHKGVEDKTMQGFHDKCEDLATRVAKVKGWDPLTKQDTDVEMLLCEGCNP